MSFNILSIDGGGLRGLIAIQFLKKLEEISGKRVHDIFDLIAGTSTGGLIACAISVSKDGNPIYTLDQIEDLYLKNGKAIFPRRHWTRRYFTKPLRLFFPQFTGRGLNNVLDHYFGNYRLQDCFVPVLITSYDVHANRPIIFRSRDVSRSSQYFSSKKNIELVKICRSTSAAPTYLPTYPFKYALDGENETRVNCIDGGIYLNNPSMVALTEVLKHRNERIYRKDASIDKSDIKILSIGNGNSSIYKTNSKLGVSQWMPELINFMMAGNSTSVDNQLTELLGINYFRADVTDIDSKHSDMANSSLSSLDYYISLPQRDRFDNKLWLNDFTKFIRTL